MISRIILKIRSKLASAKELNQTFSRSVKYKKTFLGVGAITVLYTYLYQNDDDYLVDEFPRSLPVTLYRVMPLCYFSRLFGSMASKEIPEFLRGTLLGAYAKLTGVDLSDFKITDIKQYKSLSDLFQRQLRWDSRPIDRDCDMVSPCDGTVLYCGHANNGTIEQVKGVGFTIGGFLGHDYNVWRQKYSMAGAASTTTEAAAAKEGSGPRNLFYVTLYLAPGDYHRFHAPTECDLEFRRYFTGKLLSVNPWLARLVPGLFSVNERVVYVGHWKHGLFSFTAVGATNVGNIRIFSDQDLPTNETRQSIGRYSATMAAIAGEEPRVLERAISPVVRLSRGQLFGEFSLGSTIVLVFEAPADFEFGVRPRDRVRMGQSLCATDDIDRHQCRSM